MKYIKVFESLNYDWEKEFLNISDIFLEMEDSKIARLDYQAGLLFSNGSVNSLSLPVYLKNDTIMGDKDYVDNNLKFTSKFCVRVTIYPKFDNSNFSPFKASSDKSFFGNNSITLLNVMKYIDICKNKIVGYKLDITICDNVIMATFLKSN